MSLRFIPSTPHASSTTNLTVRSSTTSHTSKPSTSIPTAPSAPGLPDILRSSISTPHASHPSTPAALTSAHPLEARLANWRQTQENMKMSGLRRTFGMGEPIRRGMELKIVRGGEWRAGVLGGTAGVGGEILEGREAECGWEDVYRGESFDFLLYYGLDVSPSSAVYAGFATLLDGDGRRMVTSMGFSWIF
ncbi:hypothetical protein MMC25_005908 [Agyrium rufum]|nr:hypothetical protein [Agyrium rufum]